MTKEQLKTLRELRNDGYAVIVWTPEEVGEASPDKIEDRLIELGWDVIESLGGPDIDGYLEGAVPIG